LPRVSALARWDGALPRPLMGFALAVIDKCMTAAHTAVSDAPEASWYRGLLQARHRTVSWLMQTIRGKAEDQAGRCTRTQPGPAGRCARSSRMPTGPSGPLRGAVDENVISPSVVTGLTNVMVALPLMTPLLPTRSAFEYGAHGSAMRNASL